MKHKNFLKLCSGNKFAATLFGILVITIISSMFFVQSVFGQISIQQIMETLQTPKIFSAAQETTIVMAAEMSTVPAAPTAEPKATHAPTAKPTATPAAEPTAAAAPTAEPTTTQSSTPAAPTAEPTSAPTAELIAEPTPKPTPKPATKPTVKQTQPAATTAAVTAAETAPPSSGCFDGGMAGAVLDLANQQRTGLCALSWSDSLAATAQVRAKEIVVSFSHTRPDGSAWYTAGSSMAENIAKEQSSSDGVMQSWMASTGHAANIMNPAYTQMGVASYCVDGTYYWVQEFS